MISFSLWYEKIHQLAKLHKDISIVWGREDKGNPLRLGQALHEILEGSVLEVLDDAKHVANSEQPELFNREVVGFLHS